MLKSTVLGTVPKGTGLRVIGPLKAYRKPFPRREGDPIIRGLMTKKIKLFTLEEANSLIPVLTPMVQELQDLRSQIDKLEVAIDSLELIAEGAAEGGQTTQELEVKISKLNEMIGQMNKILKDIEMMDCAPKSIEIGLIDFLSEKEGRHIYLCWQLGETQIKHWHEVGEGFANRQIVD